jgi:hypothetical protein
MSRLLPEYDNYDMEGRPKVDALLALAASNPLLIRRGLIPGASLVHKFGRNPALANGGWEGILQVAAQFPWLTAASAVRVKSGGNAADDGTSSPQGAGALTVTIQGLDATGAEVSETVTTAGAAASAATTTEYLRVFRAWVATTGTYTGNNTDDIVIETTGGTALIQISAGEGQTQFCGYTIPLGKVGYLASAIVQVDAAKSADFRLFTRADCTTVTAPFAAKRLKFYWDGVSDGQSVKPFTPMLTVPALTDVWIEGYGNGVGVEATANMEIILFDA